LQGFDLNLQISLQFNTINNSFFLTYFIDKYGVGVLLRDDYLRSFK